MDGQPGDWKVSESNFCPFWKILESVRIGKCQNWKVSESESVRNFFLGCPEAIDLLGQLCRDWTVRMGLANGIGW